MPSAILHLGIHKIGCLRNNFFVVRTEGKPAANTEAVCWLLSMVNGLIRRVLIRFTLSLLPNSCLLYLRCESLGSVGWLQSFNEAALYKHLLSMCQRTGWEKEHRHQGQGCIPARYSCGLCCCFPSAEWAVNSHSQSVELIFPAPESFSSLGYSYALWKTGTIDFGEWPAASTAGDTVNTRLRRLSRHLWFQDGHVYSSRAILCVNQHSSFKSATCWYAVLLLV